MKCKSNYCDRETISKGLCGKHHKRMMKGEDVNIKTFREISIKERFFNRVVKNKTTKCWIWNGSTRGNSSHKYGVFWVNGKCYSAHRYSWILHKGEIPKDEYYRQNCICHKCDYSLCVNPRHLFIGTHSDNMKDKVLKGKDKNKHKKFCKHMHMFTKENTYVSKKGIRHCRTCHRKNERRRLERLRLGG